LQRDIQRALLFGHSPYYGLGAADRGQDRQVAGAANEAVGLYNEPGPPSK